MKLINSTDKQNALRRECTFRIEIVLEIGVAGVNIYLKITVLTLSDVLVRLAQSVRPWRMIIYFYQCVGGSHLGTPSMTFLAHPSRRIRGELIVYRSSRRPSVRACVRPCVCSHFQT